MLPAKSAAVRVAPLAAARCRISPIIRWNATAAAAKPDKKSPQPKESSSFVMNLFRGRALLANVFPYPMNLADERKEMLQLMIPSVEKFLIEVNSPAKNDEQAEIPREILTQFGELGALGALVPEEYEGAGLNNVQMARLAELVGANDLALGVVMGAHQSIGYKGILLYGDEAMKRKYLPDLATGRRFAAFCLTEPTSGSDANSIRSRAEKSADGRHYVLNGGKLWISNAGFADVFTVFAQTPVQGEGGITKDRISAFIVERQFGGVTNSKGEHKMGIKGSNTAEVHFENTKIPVENLLGKEGEGFKVAMNILNNGRFAIPAACTGSMRWCIQKTIDHITERTQFGKKLKEFGNVQEQLVDMITRQYASESITYMLASNMDNGVVDYQLEAAIGKVMASENAWRVCDQAIQLHGGMGFMKDCGLERVLRDLRIFRIFEGANDVLRLFIALTGIQFAGGHLKHIASEIKSGGVSTLIGEMVRRASRSTGGDFETVVHPSLKESAQLTNKAVKEFGKTVEGLLMKYKKGIIDRQWELIRLADAAIEIYSMVAVMSRYTRTANAKLGSAHEENIANLFCSKAAKRALLNIEEIQQSTGAEVRMIGAIAADICKQKSILQMHPIDV